MHTFGHCRPGPLGLIMPLSMQFVLSPISTTPDPVSSIAVTAH